MGQLGLLILSKIFDSTTVPIMLSEIKRIEAFGHHHVDFLQTGTKRDDIWTRRWRLG